MHSYLYLLWHGNKWYSFSKASTEIRQEGEGELKGPYKVWRFFFYFYCYSKHFKSYFSTRKFPAIDLSLWGVWRDAQIALCNHWQPYCSRSAGAKWCLEEKPHYIPLTCFCINPGAEGSSAWLRAILHATYGGAAEAELLWVSATSLIIIIVALLSGDPLCRDLSSFYITL